MMNIVNEVKSQFARVLISSDWKNLLDVADYHFEEAAKLKKKDIRFTKNKLLIRNSMKRLHLGIGVELALKAAFLKQNICVNTFKKPAITDEFKNTPTHNFNEFDPDLINPNDTFTMGSLIDKFSATLGFEVSEDFLNGLRIAMTFRNKEGHCSFPEHQFDPENYKMIENSVTQLYFMAFNQELTFSIAMTKDDKGKFSKT